MHCGDTTYHTKKRGKIRYCDWCGQRIDLGERYGKWLFFDAGERSTVYAHEECTKVWEKEAMSEGYILESCGGNERPDNQKDDGE